MKRIVISLAVMFALVLGGVFANSASANGPHGHGHGHGHGHQHHGHHGHHHGHHHHHHHHNRWQPSYGGYYVPYGGGYYSGYSQHPGYYSTRSQPRIGLYFGF